VRALSREPLLTDALRVLDCFDGETGYLLEQEIAVRAQLPHEVVQVVVARLEASGIMTRSDSDVCALGLRLVSLAGQVGGLERLRSCAQPSLIRLRDTTAESANLVVPDGEFSICIDQVESRQPLRHTGWIGKRVPLAGTATGAAFAGTSGAQVADGAVEPGVTAVACLVQGAHDPRAVVGLTGPSFRLSGQVLVLARIAVESAAQDIGERLADPHIAARP